MGNTHSSPQRAVATRGPVLIIGSGLLGASLGLCLRAGGIDVILDDTSPTSLRLAQDIGAGTPRADAPDVVPALVVVAVPPDVADVCVIEALRTYPEAIVTDVASVKVAVVADVLAESQRLGDPTIASRYVGSHPMAGRERSGAGAADTDLFYGSPWVIVAHESSSPHAILAVRALAGDVGAVPIEMDATAHDRSVALVSHVPQLVASMLAARLTEAPAHALDLAGGGLRDTTRIAASDPRLWTAILAGNAGPVCEILTRIRSDLDDLIVHLEAAAERGPLRGGSVGAVNRVISAGNQGVSRIPGKHGGAPRRYAEVEVLVPDAPGELARLFGDFGEINVNIEDLALEHSSGQRVGLARVSIDPAQLSGTERALDERGWRVIAHSPIN
ncbi:prephenate dehydrogenase [Schaalia sp. ZJ405]|uniref:prephenate dehydrogenase n=1 Tax=Schaalia sp. ZJ405 TaxID=2709403 RepID=UPI0013EBE34A|nr:prephenate dehydrogenase [Schaalia sp. ZJ405]QPK82246.1 prephenate dehydrogenase [Schaalia sp. ZJ405]